MPHDGWINRGGGVWTGVRLPGGAGRGRWLAGPQHGRDQHAKNEQENEPLEYATHGNVQGE